MTKKQPLYPHVPKSRQPKFPHGVSSERIVIIDATPAMADVISGRTKRPESWDRSVPYWFWVESTHAFRKIRNILGVPIPEPRDIEAMFEVIIPEKKEGRDLPPGYKRSTAPFIEPMLDILGVGAGIIVVQDMGGRHDVDYMIGVNVDGTRGAFMLLQ